MLRWFSQCLQTRKYRPLPSIAPSLLCPMCSCRVVAGGAKGAAAAAAPANVLLLLVKQGGNGLNLTEAQHVLLVEPLLDPGNKLLWK